MSIEIPGSNQTLEDLAGEAGHLAGRAMCATGTPAQEAFMNDRRAGNYAGQYLLIALQNAGLLDIERIDVESLKDSMRQLDEEAGIADGLAALNAEEKSLFGWR